MKTVQELEKELIKNVMGVGMQDTEKPLKQHVKLRKLVESYIVANADFL